MPNMFTAFFDFLCGANTQQLQDVPDLPCEGRGDPNPVTCLRCDLHTNIYEQHHQNEVAEVIIHEGES